MSKATISARLINLRRTVSGFWLILSLVLLPRWCHSAFIPQQPESTKHPAANNRGDLPVQARRDFETRCAACHGLDGRGGEHAPNIATNPAVRQLTDGDLFSVVHDGIPAKGMPAFDHLPKRQIKSIVSYLRFLSGSSGVGLSRGNASRGEDLFFGKAGCGGCHMMNGQGGFLGADLTRYGATHEKRGASKDILNSDKFYALHQSALDNKTVEVITREGRRLTGVVRNEDNFSLQLLGADGAFHMLMKSDVEGVNRNANLIPRVDFATRLSSKQLEDVLRYVSQGIGGKDSGLNVSARATSIRRARQEH